MGVQNRMKLFQLYACINQLPIDLPLQQEMQLMKRRICDAQINCTDQSFCELYKTALDCIKKGQKVTKPFGQFEQMHYNGQFTAFTLMLPKCKFTAEMIHSDEHVSV